MLEESAKTLLQHSEVTNLQFSLLRGGQIQQEDTAKLT